MKTEIEAKFLKLDHAKIADALRKLGAKQTKPKTLMKRVIFDYELDALQHKSSYVRLRDEGDKITLTYKKFDSLSVDGAKEVEIVVDSFDKAYEFCSSIGLDAKSYQESKRETWELNGVEVMLDEWPWLEPYIEIEGDSADSIQALAEQLGLNWEDAVFGDVMVAYREQYPKLLEKQAISSLEKVEFGAELPEMLKNAR